MRSNDDEDKATRLQRALYRAGYRGTREMDFLLGRFASSCLASMSEEELTTFEKLMQFPDPVLARALVDGAGGFDSDIEALLARIRQFHKNR